MTHSSARHPDPAPASLPGLSRIGPAPSPLAAEVARLEGEVRRLESALRTRDHSTALAIHELRQPLSVLVLAAGHLGRGAVGHHKALADRLQAGALRLDGLIDDLADAFFLESGHFALQVASTDVVRLVETAVARLGAVARVSVEGDVPRVEADPRRLEQVFTNLLANAKKYGRAESPPCISIARGQGVVVVTVLNDGPSLAEDERSKVFEPYYRGRDRDPEARGLGLGLHICKKIVEEHGGRIWTDGDALHTRFSFSLPIQEAVARDAERPPAAQGVKGCSSSSSLPIATS